MVLDSDFAEAVLNGDVDLVETWLQSLERQEDINEVDGDGNTVLNLLAHGFHDGERDNIRGIKMILARGGADLELGDDVGWTPLRNAMNAEFSFGREAVALLLAAGANPNAKWHSNEIFHSPLSAALDYFKDCRMSREGGADATMTLTGLEYATLLLRAGASLDDCWAGGATAENLMRHLENRTTPAIEACCGGDEYSRWRNDIPDLAENAHFLACKALIKKARSEPRITVLTLRVLAIKGRAKTADPFMMKFLVGIPDDVVGHVLSFWPPATRYIEARRPGTGQLPYRPKREMEENQYYNGQTCPICGQARCPGGPPGCVGGRSLIIKRTESLYHSISKSPVYSGKSFEELRLEDYDQARDEGKWWPGGPLQISTGLPPPRVLPKGHVPYRPTHKIWSGNVGLSVDGDVESVPVYFEVVHHAITAMPEYSGKSFEEIRLEETYQEGRDWGNRLLRVCADCGRSLTRENYSNTQLKKRVGVSRCKDCVVRVWPT